MSAFSAFKAHEAFVETVEAKKRQVRWRQRTVFGASCAYFGSILALPFFDSLPPVLTTERVVSYAACVVFLGFMARLIYSGTEESIKGRLANFDRLKEEVTQAAEQQQRHGRRFTAQDNPWTVITAKMNDTKNFHYGFTWSPRSWPDAIENYKSARPIPRSTPAHLFPAPKY